MLPSAVNWTAVSRIVLFEQEERFIRYMILRLQAEQLELVQVVVDDVLHRAHRHVQHPQLLGSELRLVGAQARDHPIDEERGNDHEDDDGDLADLAPPRCQ